MTLDDLERPKRHSCRNNVTNVVTLPVPIPDAKIWAIRFYSYIPYISYAVRSAFLATVRYKKLHQNCARLLYKFSVITLFLQE